MQIETSKTEYIPVKSDNFIEPKLTARADFSNIQTRLSEIIDNIISPKKELSLNEQINEKFLELDFGSEFDIDATRIGAADAAFFVNLLNQNNLINYTVEADKISLSLDDKKISATNSLINMLKTSLDSNKSIRLDFDSDVTVILKLDKEGKIQAHFIPGTSEVESYLKNNIPILKQTFDDEEINYSYLGYSQNKNKKEKEKDDKQRQKEQ